MKRRIIMVLSVGLMLSGCARLADSNINPLNWFGRSSNVVTPANPEDIRPLIPRSNRAVVVDARVLIATITEMTINRTPDGAIISATGIAETQGFFNAELVIRAVENGVLTYDFRVETPAGFQAIGSAASRRITAAATLSNDELASVRSIQVRGANNSRSSRR